ncbi:hypothetical protein VTN96DRAFT_6871 [Rasamsonia emersonii]
MRAGCSAREIQHLKGAATWQSEASDERNEQSVKWHGRSGGRANGIERRRGSVDGRPGSGVIRRLESAATAAKMNSRAKQQKWTGREDAHACPPPGRPTSPPAALITGVHVICPRRQVDHRPEHHGRANDSVASLTSSERLELRKLLSGQSLPLSDQIRRIAPWQDLLLLSRVQASGAYLSELSIFFSLFLSSPS